MFFIPLPHEHDLWPMSYNISHQTLTTLGSLTCKIRLPYNLYCVGGDVKHCSIQSNPITLLHVLSTVVYYFTMPSGQIFFIYLN